MNYVYILKCTGDTLYTGWTVDLEKRWKADCSGKGAKYTKAHPPLAIVWFAVYETKQQAQSMEWKIKHMSRKEKMLLIEEAGEIPEYGRINPYLIP